MRQSQYRRDCSLALPMTEEIFGEFIELNRKRKSENRVEKIKKRVAEMVKERPSHKEALEFFGDVVIEQCTMGSRVETAPLEIDEADFKLRIIGGFPLVEKRALTLDIPLATRLFRRLCKMMSQNKKASQDAERILVGLQNKEVDILELLKQADSGNGEFITALSKKLGIKKDVLVFLAKNSIKPIFEGYAKELGNYVDQERWWKGYCPICGSEPFMAELKEEGARYLVCSSCSFEWRFNRLKCPFCENDNHEKLRYFYAEQEGRTYRIDVCDVCKRYIKTIDTAQMGVEVIPILEDAGTLFLDVLARNEGFTKEGISLKSPVNA
jgi:FdhE protein